MKFNLDPMLATLVDEAFDDKEWVFEVKWDGYRLIAAKERTLTLYSRNHIDVSKKYPNIQKALARLSAGTVVDGELVALDARGKPRFELMQHVDAQTHLVYYAFDLLYLKGKDVRTMPLLERKKLLKKVLPKSKTIRYSDHVAARGKAYFTAASKQGLEGIVAKKADSIYESGRRSPNWQKIKCGQKQEVVIVGYTAPRNSRKYLGSLVLAVRDGERWKYVGHTGGGLAGMSLKEMHERLKPLVTKAKPLSEKVPREKEVMWVRPKLVGEVKFTEWTAGGQMRHPTFAGLRSDKKSSEVVMEKPKDVSSAPNELKLSNLQKVYWPKDGYTKGDLVEYYKKISELMLPYLADRPENLNRHPGGIDGKNFYQKDASDLHLPEFVQTKTIYSDSNERNLEYILCNNEETLLYLANLGCIEINPWSSRASILERPDFMIIDLDPGDNTFNQVVEVAKVVHEVLELSCEKSYVKTSGKTGLHILVPLGAKYTYEQVRNFCQLLMRLVHDRIPDITSLQRSPAKRKKLIYLDYLQNGKGQTIAAPYSLRPWPGATVSTPLEWREVKKGLSPEQFTIKTIFPRLKKKGDLFTGLLEGAVDLKEATKCLAAELKKRTL